MSAEAEAKATGSLVWSGPIEDKASYTPSKKQMRVIAVRNGRDRNFKVEVDLGPDGLGAPRWTAVDQPDRVLRVIEQALWAQLKKASRRIGANEQ